MAKHSSIVGGSTAARLLNCPGSYQATLKLPPSADRSSEFAEEGTAMHAVMTELMLRRGASARHGVPPANAYAEAAKMKGVFVHDRELTQEHLDTMIFPALDALADLEAQYGGGFEVAGVEIGVVFPGILGAYGTCDLLLASGTTMLHVDWKFGQGVGVKAVYRDDKGETVNAQLLFYAAGAMNSRKALYTGIKSIALAIIQPRSDTPLTHVAVSKKEIRWFIEDLHAAVVAAQEYDPPRSKGEHCRFAPCKVDCPLWTGPMLEIAALKPVTNKDNGYEALGVTAYGQYLAKAKTLTDMLAMFTKEVNEQLHSYLEHGGQVPGWRLKDKVKNRQWIDEDSVMNALTELGFKYEEVFQSKLTTFAAAEATAKRLGVVIPDHLRVAPSTNETTVCRTDDPAPPVERRVAIEEFASALKALT